MLNKYYILKNKIINNNNKYLLMQNLMKKLMIA